jgi:hypothetical protein
LKALFEVVSKAGKNMNEASRNSILGLIDNETDDSNGKHSTCLPLKSKLMIYRCNGHH